MICNWKMWPFLVMAVLCSLCSVAQWSSTGAGALTKARGNTQTLTFGVWAAVANPAALCTTNGFEAGTYFESPYGVRELSSQTLVAAYGNKLGVWGLGLMHFGYSAYSEWKCSASFGRWLIPQKLALGIRSGFYSIRLEEIYGHSDFLVAEAGIAYYPLKRLCVGLHVDNLASAQFADRSAYTPPTTVNLAASWAFEQHLTVYAEAQKVLDRDETRFKTGLSFLWLDRFTVACGLQTFPFSPSLGVGFRWGAAHFDMAFSRTDPLGYTPHISLTYAH